MSTAGWTYRFVKGVYEFLVGPLRIDESEETFTLSIPEAQTTTVDSVQGWSERPPAVLECPGCTAEITQRRSSTDIDCPNCYRSFKPHDFGHVELLRMTCPRCDSEMYHGIRHPNVFDIPEWATCPDCQYHWDLSHWFTRKPR